MLSLDAYWERLRPKSQYVRVDANGFGILNHRRRHAVNGEVTSHVFQPYDRSSFISSHCQVMDVQEDARVAERAFLTKFEKREWFLENLRFILSLDLNQDPSDEDSRSELLRLHYMELTVSDCARVGIGLVLMACLLFLLCVDQQLPRAALSLGSVP